MEQLLYVEDNEVNALVMQLMLKEQYRVDVAKEPRQALRLLRQKQYALILMDINLGLANMDGVQLAKLIWKEPQWRHKPIIAVTAYYTPEQQAFFAKQGFFAFHPKPVEKGPLVRTIQQALGASNRR